VPLEKQPAEAVAFLQGFDPTNQELFMRVLPALAVLNEKKIEQLSPRKSPACKSRSRAC